MRKHAETAPTISKEIEALRAGLAALGLALATTRSAPWQTRAPPWVGGLTVTTVTCNVRYMAVQEREPRREQLLEATVDYILENGVSDLSLRPLAAAVGSKARLLIYHFGSRDALISSALSLVLHRIQDAFLALHGEATLDLTLLAFWRWATDKATEPYLRLVFEVHGLAPRNPRLYGGYVQEAFASWRFLITETLKKRKAAAHRREELATLIIAVVDGLLLDYLATGDRERTGRALSLFTRQLKAGKNGGIR